VRASTKPWYFLSLLAIATAAVLFAIYSYRHRLVRSDADMLALLPSGQATVFFIDVAVLRQAGVLTLLTGSKPVSDPEYREFVRQTHFDYTTTLDAIAGKVRREGVFLIARGRFEWGELRDYAKAHGGFCVKHSCSVPSSKAGRWVIFSLIQPAVMALTFSASSSAFETLRRDDATASALMRSEPVWVNIPVDLLRNPKSVPQPLQTFAMSLQFADSIVLSLARPIGNNGAVFNVRLDANFRSAVAAETARNQLEIQTRTLKLDLAREHQIPNPRDLTGLLTAGTFQVVGQHLTGAWPVRNELLNALK